MRVPDRVDSKSKVPELEHAWHFIGGASVAEKNEGGRRQEVAILSGSIGH